jgi:hypothetical protein
LAEAGAADIRAADPRAPMAPAAAAINIFFIGFFLPVSEVFDRSTSLAAQLT